MVERHDATRPVATAKHSSARLSAGWLLILSGLLALQAGCQEESSNVRGPSMGAEPARIAEPSGEAIGVDSQADEAQAVKSPRLVIETMVHDFGEIGPGTSHSAKFKFKNTGTGPLKIAQVRSCCGVVTRGVKAGQVYKPGESGALELDYRASLQPGSMKRNLYIQSDDPLLGVAALTIKATIVPRVEYKPTRLRLFMNKDNAGADSIELKSLDGKPFAIKGFRSTAKSITADFDPSVQATEFSLKLKADMDKLERNLKGQISIDLNHPECKNIRMLYDVLPEFTINPQQIMLFNIQAGQPVQREIWILSNYQAEFEIESVSSQKGTVKLLEKKKVDNRCQLKIEITPPAVDSERAVMSDVVDVKIEGGQALTIQCRGFYQGS